MNNRSVKKIWKLGAHHEFPNEALNEYRSRNIIAIGWAYSGDLRDAAASSPKEIEESVFLDVPDRENAREGGINLWRFYNEIKTGDLVLVVSEDKNAIFKVKSDYFYSDKEKAIFNYRHQIPADLTELTIEDLMEEYVISPERIREKKEVLSILMG